MNLPPEIHSSLRRIVQRIRKIQLIKGLLAVFAALILSMLVAMVIDWAFNVQYRFVRVLLSVAVLIITLITAWRYLLRPLTRRIPLNSVARWVENQHPEIQERISTAVELSGRGDVGSQALIQQLVEEAVVDVGKLDPKRELTARATRKPMWTAIAGVAILGGLFIYAPSIMRVLVQRVVAPFSDVGNAYAANVRFLTPDKQIVPANDSFNLDAVYKASREQRAVIVLTYPDGTEVREQMMEDSSLPTENSQERGIRFRLPTQPPSPTPDDPAP